DALAVVKFALNVFYLVALFMAQSDLAKQERRVTRAVLQGRVQRDGHLDFDAEASVADGIDGHGFLRSNAWRRIGNDAGGGDNEQNNHPKIPDAKLLVVAKSCSNHLP